MLPRPTPAGNPVITFPVFYHSSPQVVDKFSKKTTLFRLENSLYPLEDLIISLRHTPVTIYLPSPSLRSAGLAWKVVTEHCGEKASRWWACGRRERPVWCRKTSPYPETFHPEDILEYRHGTVSFVDCLSGSVKFIYAIINANGAVCVYITRTSTIPLLVTCSALHHFLGPPCYFFTLCFV